MAAPDERLLYSVFRQSTATYGLVAEADGKYQYCFSNQMSSVSDKTVAFSVMGPDERSTISMKMEQADNTDGAWIVGVESKGTWS